MRIELTPYAREKLYHYIDLCPGEVSGMGRITYADDVFTVHDLTIFEQTASGAHSDIEIEALARFQMEKVKAGEDLSEWRLWFHSHAGMKTFFSGTDMATINSSTEFPWMVSLVSNHDHDYSARLDVFQPFRLHTDLEVYEQITESAELKKEIEKEIAEKVKKPVYKKPEKKEDKKGTRDLWGEFYDYPAYRTRDNWEIGTGYKLPARVDIEREPEIIESAAGSYADLDEYYTEKEELKDELADAKKAGDPALVSIAETMLWDHLKKGEQMGIEN